MAKKPNREKQTAILLEAQEKRKQQKREQVFRAIEQMQKLGQPLTFPAIAKVAGCSVSYLYKWTQLTEYIHDLQRQKTEALNAVEEKSPGPHSLRTLHDASKQRIRDLKAEIEELKRQNELLRGHVVEVSELRDECERLRKLVRKYEQALPQSKVISLHFPPEEPSPEPKPKPSPEPKQRSIEAELQAVGITLNQTLKRTIKSASEETVLDAIEAYKEALATGKIERPGGWLKKAIEEGWKPNDSVQAKSELDTFKEWFPLAREKGIVIASQKSKEGIVVCTNEGHWLPLAEMLAKYPLETL